MRKAFERAGGFCERCGAKLWRGVEYHHIIEAYLGGDNSLENCCVACRPCHVELTAERHPAIDKTRRLADKQMNITKRKKRPFGDPRYRKKMSGEVVPK
jgi:5-methylcytosine-specific restriction endonuclease McrA